MALRPLLRQELPWLITEFVLLIVLLNANLGDSTANLERRRLGSVC